MSRIAGNARLPAVLRTVSVCKNTRADREEYGQGTLKPDRSAFHRASDFARYCPQIGLAPHPQIARVLQQQEL
jgi:hypothetical protein